MLMDASMGYYMGNRENVRPVFKSLLFHFVLKQVMNLCILMTSSVKQDQYLLPGILRTKADLKYYPFLLLLFHPQHPGCIG